jgi:hypothetical protein
MEHGNQLEACTELEGLTFALSGQGRYTKALRLHGAVEAKRDEFGVTIPQVGFWLDWIEEYVNGARNAVGEKEAVQYELQGRVMGFEKAVEYALDFEKD